MIPTAYIEISAIIGDSTHHHDQVMTLVSLSVMNTIVRSVNDVSDKFFIS
jgi:hypothetical protein